MIDISCLLSYVALFLIIIPHNHAISAHPILILLSFDGFRYDFLYRPNLTHFTQLRDAWTFVPHMRPVFPSKTYPNHVTMATGLFSESHGVIGPYINTTSGAVVDKNETEFWTYNSEEVHPIWELNEHAADGRFSGCMMWPGCAPHEAANPPTYAQTYNRSIPWHDRVSMVFDWLRDPEKPANLILWYIEEPDFTGHKHGPDSPEVDEQLARADDLLGYIISKLRLFELEELVNLVVTSDHGLAAVPGSHLISLDRVLRPDWYRALGPDPVFRIVPAPGKSLAVYDALRDGAEKLGLNYTVYVKEKIPERWHYRHNPRVPDILVVADEGYLFTNDYINKTVKQLRAHNYTVMLGNHGYDSESAAMEHPLLARGPAFRRRFVHTTVLQNVDVFPLCALVLRLPQSPSNGSLARVRPLLAHKQSVLGGAEARAPFWAAVIISAVFGLCVLSVLFVVLRRHFRRKADHSSIVNGYKFRYAPVQRSRTSRRVELPLSLSATDDDDGEEVEHLLPSSSQPASGV